MRVVELPLGATEDRVIGSLDLGHILASGERRFEPGLLAQANGNILYVDEINLLEDHLVDLLLDSAAMGINYVEREGVSYSHPARFILVGSMNPEEGELRPQLLDRFGLSVDVRSEGDPVDRAEILSRRLAFDADPEGYVTRWAGDESVLAQRILTAQALLPSVSVPKSILGRIATAGIRLETDGHRADLALAKAAMAHAALRGVTTVDYEDLLACAALALGHRMRRQPFQERGVDKARLKAALASDTGDA
jgi:magnesium chelatase subunit I